MKAGAFVSLFCIYLFYAQVSGAPGGLKHQVDDIEERLKIAEKEIAQLEGNVSTLYTVLHQ